MYLLLRFQPATASFWPSLYFALIALTVALGLSASSQASLNNTLLIYSNIILLLKLSVLVVLWMLNKRRLAYIFAGVGIVWSLLFSDMIPHDDLSMVMVLTLLAASLLLELGKLYKLDAYYGNKTRLDIAGLAFYIGLIFILV